jgi:hypothetical protein
VSRPNRERSNDREAGRAVAWFGILSAAATSGDFSAAATAQQKLAELGWRVGRQPVDVPRGERGGVE